MLRVANVLGRIQEKIMAELKVKRNCGSFLIGAGNMGKAIADHDWSQTPLGPLEDWPISLQTAVSIVLNSQHPMFVAWGSEMTFIYNDAYISVLSYSKHPWALGRPFREVWSEIWDVCGPLADKVFKEARASYMDNIRLFMRRPGFLEEVYYSFSYSPIRDENGEVRGLFCPSAETTAKLLNERRLRTLSELSANALREKTVASALASAAQTLAKNYDDIPFALLYLTDQLKDEATLCEAVGLPRGLDGLSPERVHFISLPEKKTFWPFAEVVKDGRLRAVDVRNETGLPLGLADQKISHAIVLPVSTGGGEWPQGILVAGINPCRNLDPEYETFFKLVANQMATAVQSAQIYEAEKRRAEELAELDKAKTVFFSNVSHEFRTPLTLMLGPLRDALSEVNDEPMRERLNLVHRNGQRLLKLVNTLLDFSRIEAGRIEASFEPTDLSEFTRELVSVFRSATEKAGLALEVNCPPLSESVYVDRDMWEKIILNLVSNAFKFTLKGHIAVGLRELPNSVELTVEDTGIGVPEKEVPRLFERFHRVEGARGRTHEGSGIGLALVQELVKIHCGQVRVASQFGEGTTFWVEIPKGQAHLPAEKIRAGKTLGSTSTGSTAFLEEATRWLPGEKSALSIVTSTPTVVSTPGARILLADDNADMRDYVEHLLCPYWKIETAADGWEAFEKARANPPALILSDIMMPGLDGIGLINKLREIPELREVPVILLSARAGEEARVEGLKSGADDYLVKPFSAKELIARIDASLKIARVRSDSSNAVRESEERLRLGLQTARMTSWELDLRTRRLRASENFRDFMGRFADEANPTASFLDYVHPEDLARVNVLVEKAIAERGAFSVEFRSKYDPETWHEATGKLFCDAENTPVRIIGVTMDISERKRFEQILQEREAYFRNLVDISPALLWITEADGECTYLSKRWYEYTGRSIEADLRFGWIDNVHPDDRQNVHDTFLDAVANAKNFTMDYRLRRFDGVYRWMADTGHLRRDSEGKALGYVGTVVDIHERRETQDALRSQAEELARSNADLARFAFVASHDLKEPLRVVSNYVQLLQQVYTGKLDASGLQYMRFITDAIKRMYSLINDLLSYARIGATPETMEPQDFNSLMQEVLANLESSIDESKAVVSVPSMPIVVSDRGLMLQLFQNLVSNALKYRAPDRNPKIDILAERENDMWVFTVRDNGIGIRSDYFEKIFVLFQRLHTRDHYSGTGIGLAVCKRIVERHQGRIWVDSTPDVGSAFSFAIPDIEQSPERANA